MCQQIMEQFSATSSTSRVMDKESNGLVLCNKNLPVEIMIKIFFYIDWRTAMKCIFVCKRWKNLMNYVWHKKTEQILAKPFPRDDKMPWCAYYLSYKKQPYKRNLVKNPCGYDGITHWKIDKVDNVHRWKNFDLDVSPLDYSVHLSQVIQMDIWSYFTTVFDTDPDSIRFKTQNIVLFNRGIHPYILDVYQPPITVIEWYCKFKHSEIYHLNINLLDDQKNSIDFCEFCDDKTEGKLNCWQMVMHVFKNYGPGARSISFQHGIKGGIWGRGECYRGAGCSITGAYVSVNIPKNICISTANANE